MLIRHAIFIGQIPDSRFAGLLICNCYMQYSLQTLTYGVFPVQNLCISHTLTELRVPQQVHVRTQAQRVKISVNNR